jgi:hypothetical protein
MRAGAYRIAQVEQSNQPSSCSIKPYGLSQPRLFLCNSCAKSPRKTRNGNGNGSVRCSGTKANSDLDALHGAMLLGRERGELSIHTDMGVVAVLDSARALIVDNVTIHSSRAVQATIGEGLTEHQ